MIYGTRIKRSSIKKKRTFIESKIDSAYNEIVYWKKVRFLLPIGAVGKGFIVEVTKQ